MTYRVMRVSVFLLLITTVFAGAYLDYFHVRNDGDDAIIEWKTSQETNLKEFVIQRSTPQTQWVDIATVAPQPNNPIYSYTDKSVYKANDYIFIYRLKIVDNDLQLSYSSAASVSLSISGVKRTWGSIKAMFR
jgi:hypothetical protein